MHFGNHSLVTAPQKTSQEYANKPSECIKRRSEIPKWSSRTFSLYSWQNSYLNHDLHLKEVFQFVNYPVGLVPSVKQWFKQVKGCRLIGILVPVEIYHDNSIRAVQHREPGLQPTNKDHRAKLYHNNMCSVFWTTSFVKMCTVKLGVLYMCRREEGGGGGGRRVLEGWMCVWVECGGSWKEMFMPRVQQSNGKGTTIYC